MDFLLLLGYFAPPVEKTSERDQEGLRQNFAFLVTLCVCVAVLVMIHMSDKDLMALLGYTMGAPFVAMVVGKRCRDAREAARSIATIFLMAMGVSIIGGALHIISYTVFFHVFLYAVIFSGATTIKDV